MKTSFRTRTMVVSIIVSAVIIMLAMFGNERTREKTAYINIGKVYESFNLTKELNAHFETVKNQRQLILDSLGMRIERLARTLNTGNPDKNLINLFNGLKDDYQYKQQEFQRDNEALKNNYNDQIMNQINQYVEDYGKSLGYTYIFGTNGDGSIMYAKDSHEISDEIINYINERYAGK